MINKTDEKPVLLSKRKNIQLLIDYCLEHKLAFTVTPRPISNDEFEVEIDIVNFKQAIALGMFAKENKFEVTGLGDLVKPKSTTGKKAENKETPAPSLTDFATDKDKKEDAAALNFGLGIENN